MPIYEVIRTLNQMQADGLLENYAIGGAVGATFYLEPVATLDVDVFISLKPEAGSLLVEPGPLFNYLKARGCRMDGEYIVITGWPLLFLPPPSPLVVDDLSHAFDIIVAGVTARVFTAEHLAAIALQTGRAKDKSRLLQFIEANALDAPRFQDILSRHALVAAWMRFEQQFLRDPP